MSKTKIEVPDGQPPTEGAAASCAPVACSLSGFGSEILIAQWEARAEQCERTHEQFKSVLSHMLSCYQEKARAYRAAAQDLRRQMEHEKKRRPTENDESSNRSGNRA